MQPEAFVIFFALALFLAAGWDLATLTIPNRLVWLVGALGLVLSFGLSGAELLRHALLALAVLLFGALAFARGIWGGGDAKLLAAVALFAGPEGFPAQMMVTALTGGCLALILLLARRFGPARAPSGVPYGVAIAAGGLWLVAGQAGS